ncbi:MAG: VENN motif pre-toxin domain-containing protein, partial [Neisseriaceae bacterium]|nr:VENN motif pre-toxin domain-containing protein [Neisseriaceae bacterium]
ADSLTGVAVSAVSPAVSYAVGQHFKKEGKEGSFEHIATHAVIGALTSAANGGNALSGAVSAGSAEYIAQVTAQTLFKKDANELTADEKQTVSSIAQLVGVVSGSVTGDSSVNAYVGNTVATNAVDNNLLNPKHSWTGNYLTEKSANKKTSVTVSGDKEIMDNLKKAENCALYQNCEALANQFTDWSRQYLAMADELDAQGKHVEAKQARELAQQSSIGAGMAVRGLDEQREMVRNNGQPIQSADFSRWNDGRPSVWQGASSKTPDYYSGNVGINILGHGVGASFMQSAYDDSYSGGFYFGQSKPTSSTQPTVKQWWKFVDVSVTSGNILTDEHGRTLTVQEQFDKEEMQKRTKEFIDGKSISTGACVGFACGKKVYSVGKNKDGSPMRYSANEVGVSATPLSFDLDGSITWENNNNK